jgi:ABC-type Fe3+ transport system permease subunit
MMDFTTACCYTGVMEHSGPGTSLFSRLMIFFMIVMLVPVLLLAFAYFVTGSKSIENNLSERGLNDIRISASRMVALIEVYRHKAYSISVDDSITSLVQQDEEMAESAGKLNSVYERMFSIMRGDTYRHIYFPNNTICVTRGTTPIRSSTSPAPAAKPPL